MTTEDGLIESTTPVSEGQSATGNGLSTLDHDENPSWRVDASQAVSYEVRLCRGLLDPASDLMVTAASADGGPGRRRLVVLDSQVDVLFGERIRAYLEAHRVTYELCVIEADERRKTMASVFRVVSAMDAFGVARRREPVIAVGGGVLTDIVGLAASLYRRSTPYVRVPTTLIGMVDAGIGSKTGVNFSDHKNRLGTYHPSATTLIDPGFLAALPARHLRNGLAEVLKMALIKDRRLFELLADHGARIVAERMQPADSADGGAAALAVIRLAIGGMLQELQPNLWEHQLERVVDYGHSFSPVIEMRALPELLHGEAVAVDMALSLVLAHHRGLLSAEELTRARRVLGELGLPTWHPVCSTELLTEALADTVRHRDGRQLIPLTAGIGQARFVDDVTPAELTAALGGLEPNWTSMAAAPSAPTQGSHG
ncbi:sedoheptulose 7-phosphate cyclase [Micromonospora carbonacea]|uniref:2-epi-5-epi-valiolone synthase n=1 Tax=Micromonospora carbonacea TaxID=47853 RepID=A0A1C4ZR95_9ACTN|nr:sedoheptulose 7-phosphate cyclase [Micromonospora carbonacea]SCF35523.1 3-dehydroquinate synthase [Micromonospora carbonacea]